MSALRIGTCSWKYPSWKGLVYSAGNGINYLEEYAAKYDTVEIDQWFWSLHGEGKISLPRAETVREYASVVPPDFRFTIKVPNSVTLSHFHQKSKKDALVENPDFLSIELFHRFLDTLEPMRGLLGPLMLQFEYLNRQKIPAQSLFLDRLGTFLEACPAELRIGIESRNPNYLNRAYFDLLAEHGAHHVFLQGYYMPPIWEVSGRSGETGADVSVIRLHGPDRKGMEERSGEIWDHIIEARDEELQSVAALVKGILSRGVDVFLNVNNHYEGSAPLTIQRIRELLGIEPAKHFLGQ
ncbi:MAG: DUF72 domain-containing protein [Bacteroidetes bacterium]|nr:DUF72 domain-containing protein [Bacteroidota bacterium]